MESTYSLFIPALFSIALATKDADPGWKWFTIILSLFIFPFVWSRYERIGADGLKTHTGVQMVKVS